MFHSSGLPAFVTGALLACCPDVRAAVTLEWVPVGDAQNAPDTRYETPGYGGVEYPFRIARCEVTNGQYIEFLNAVAASDPNGLYNEEMVGTYGGIARAGVPGAYTYGPKDGDANWLNRPVNFVSFYDALRLANWLHNGQPTGPQDGTTTEDGAYDLSLGSAVVRKPDAQVFLTGEHEWYKAAFYKGGGPDAGYWDYATQSDTIPTAEAPPGTDMGNGSANYGGIGLPYNTTGVGSYTAMPSESAYGTYDQNGNLFEWNEADVFGDGSTRGLRGGSWCCPGHFLGASFRHSDLATMEAHNYGVRLASPAGEPVPVPTASQWSLIALVLSLLVAGTLVVHERQRARASGVET